MATPRIITTRLLLWADGMALTPGLIVLRPARAADHALIAHEKRHCEQMREVGMLRFWWNYLTSPAFRLHMEVEAYRVQLAMRPSSIDHYAQALATRYFLDINIQQARDLLLEPAR